MNNFSFVKQRWVDASLQLEAVTGFALNKLTHLDLALAQHQTSVKNWELLSDQDILEEGMPHNFISHNIYAITDISYLKEIIFRLPSTKNFELFMKHYVEEFHESFFNGDVFIICLEAKRLLYFHHNGYWLTYALPLSFLQVD